MAHLQVETKLVVELSVAPPKFALQNLQGHEHSRRHVRPRRLPAVEIRKNLLINPAKHLVVKRVRPRGLQPLPKSLRQKGSSFEKGLLAVVVVSLKHRFGEGARNRSDDRQSTESQTFFQGSHRDSIRSRDNHLFC